MIVEFSNFTSAETKFSPSLCKKPNILELVSTVTSLFPQSIHSSTLPGTNFMPLAIICLIPSLIWYSPPWIMLLSRTDCNSFLRTATSLK